MAYDNKNTGILGKNERREKDTHPPYNGSADIDGVEYWISAWIKQRKDDPERKFFSLSFKRKDKQSSPSSTQDDDSIPI